MSPIDLHLGRFADDDEIGLDPGVHLDEGIGCDPVAPLLHVAEVVDGVALQEAEVTGNGQAMDHARRAALLVACAPRVEATILHLTHERIPLPLVGITDAYGIDVGVIHDDLWPIADAADCVSHPVEAHLIVTELAHLRLDPFAHRPNLRFHARNGADIAHELDDVIPLRLYPLLNLGNMLHSVCYSLLFRPFQENKSSKL